MELLVIIITLALIFDYINGFHDAANSIAVSYTHLDVYKRQILIYLYGNQCRNIV